MSERSSIEFVQYIEKYPCLYNNTLSEYSRTDFTEKAWTEIAKKMNGSTVADCKEKWRNIRNGFVRSLKAPPRGSSSKTKKPYYLHDVMKFVMPYVKPVKQNLKNVNKDIERSESIKIEETNNIETVLQHLVDDDIYDIERSESIKIEETNNIETVLQHLVDDDTETNLMPFATSTAHVEKQSTMSSQKIYEYASDDVEQTFTKKEKTDVLVENPRKMFLLSLLPDVEGLSDNNMRLLKMEMMTLVHKYNVSQQNKMNK